MRAEPGSRHTSRLTLQPHWKDPMQLIGMLEQRPEFKAAPHCDLTYEQGN
jgi:hypothetical protein